MEAADGVTKQCALIGDFRKTGNGENLGRGRLRGLTEIRGLLLGVEDVNGLVTSVVLQKPCELYPSVYLGHGDRVDEAIDMSREYTVRS